MRRALLATLGIASVVLILRGLSAVAESGLWELVVAGWRGVWSATSAIPAFWPLVLMWAFVAFERWGGRLPAPPGTPVRLAPLGPGPRRPLNARRRRAVP